MATPIVFTLNSVSTTIVSVTITDFGYSGDVLGSPTNTHNLLFTQADSTIRTFSAPSNFFQLSVAKNILFTDGKWDVSPVVSAGNTVYVRITDTFNTNVPQSSLLNYTVAGGGGGACFVAASQLLTPSGYKSAADIKTGDLLMTADGRKVPVKAFSFTVENANKDSAPFLLPANSLSPSCPKADLRLSPWHAIEMKKGLWMKPMSAFELGMPVKQYDLGKDVTYYHFEAPNFFKDNLVCDGTVVESFGGLQLADFKGRVYTYSKTQKGYTRAAGKQAPKTIMM
jgi:hypothetical protein